MENSINTTSGILIRKFVDHQPYFTFLHSHINREPPQNYIMFNPILLAIFQYNTSRCVSDRNIITTIMLSIKSLNNTLRDKLISTGHGTNVISVSDDRYRDHSGEVGPQEVQQSRMPKLKAAKGSVYFMKNNNSKKYKLNLFEIGFRLKTKYCAMTY